MPKFSDVTMEDKPPVPHAKVDQIAKAFHELMTLKDRQASTMAELLRHCTAALRRTPGPFDDAAKRREIAADKRKALLYLDYLATQLENQAVRQSDRIEGKD